MNITAYKSSKFSRVCKVFIFGVAYLVTILWEAWASIEINALEQTVSTLQGRTDSLEKQSYEKVSKKEFGAILNVTEQNAEDIGVLRQYLSQWDGLFKQFFEPSQKEYIKTHKGK